MALRIFHTADWHLGHSLHGLPRDFEHACFLDSLLDTLEERQADSLLIAGDLFDSANPPASAQAMLYRLLVRAGRRLSGLQVVMIAGNHDSAARRCRFCALRTWTPRTLTISRSRTRIA